MDLIANLSKTMGIEPKAATALAGAMLGGVAAQAEASDTDAHATDVTGAVPELGSWLDQARAFVGQDATPSAPAASTGGGLLGALTGAASSGAGNALLGAIAGKEAQQAALLVGVMQKIGLSTTQAAAAAPLVASFLKNRLGADHFDTLLKAAPLLTGQLPTAAPSASGGVAGALGGLLGR